jgi:hypothetical protein
MSWEIEIPLIIRTLINDLDPDSPTYSDDRIKQLAVVAARYVVNEIPFSTQYNLDIVNSTITPDPSDDATRDVYFISFVSLKSACLLDQSTFRTKAVSEGIRTALGPANLQVAGNLAGYKTLLDVGPCKTYEQSRLEYVAGNTQIIRAVLSPFVGNNFDPRYLLRGAFRSTSTNDFYS